jgi:type I restriction enzyme, S subunit
MIDKSILPVHWEVKKLKSIAEITSSKRIFQNDYVNTGIPFYRTKEIKELSEGKELSIELFISEEKYEEIKNKFDVPQIGDILISAVGTIGVSYIIKHDSPFYFKDGNLLWIRNIKGIIPSYLNYYIAHFIRFKQNIATSGSAYNALTIIKLKEFDISLPPLSEQQEIVAKIEELFSELDKGKEQLETARQQLKVYRQAVLKWAFEGKFTNATQNQQITHEGELPEGWEWVKISEVADSLDNRRKPVNKEERSKRQGDIPYYGANGRTGWIDDFLFDEPLILVVEDETFVGRELPFSYKITGKSWVNNHAHILKPKEILDIDFLNYQLAYYPFLPLTTGTTGRKKLTKNALMNAPFKVCSLKEQQQIVQEIESRLSVCDKVEETITQSLQQAETLRQSILKQAFEGKLVSTSKTVAEMAEKVNQQVSINLPPLEAQQKITQEIENQLSNLEKEATAKNLSQQEVETLRQGILKQAFEGKESNSESKTPGKAGQYQIGFDK